MGRQQTGFQQALPGPNGFVQSGFIHVRTGEEMELLVGFDALFAELKWTAETVPNRKRTCVEVFGPSQDCRQLIAVFRSLTELASLEQSGDETPVFFGPVPCKFRRHQQNFLRMTPSDRGTQSCHPASALDYCHRIPWLAHAVTIEVPGFQVGRHLRRRDYHDVDVPGWVDSAVSQPFLQQKIVRGTGKRDAESECSSASPGANEFAECRDVLNAALPKSVGKRDAIAMQVQDQTSHARHSERTHALANRQDHRSRGVSRFQFTQNNLVTDRGPAHLSAQGDLQTMRAEQIKFLRHD